MNRNDQATLVTVTANGATVTRTEKTLFCAKKSVAYTEFYAATQVGINPKYIFVFDLDDYEASFVTVGTGEAAHKVRPTELIYRGEKFNIIRTYENHFEIEVTVGL